MNELLPFDINIRQFYKVTQCRAPHSPRRETWEWLPNIKQWHNNTKGAHISPGAAWEWGWRIVDVADPPPETNRKYYITAIDAGRTAFLAGPYSTHKDALSKVDKVRKKTEEFHPFAVFWAFGTISLEGKAQKTWLGSI
jgi:hypothetical protein